MYNSKSTATSKTLVRTRLKNLKGTQGVVSVTKHQQENHFLSKNSNNNNKKRTLPAQNKIPYGSPCVVLSTKAFNLFILVDPTVSCHMILFFPSDI